VGNASKGNLGFALTGIASRNVLSDAHFARQCSVDRLTLFVSACLQWVRRNRPAASRFFFDGSACIR